MSEGEKFEHFTRKSKLTGIEVGWGNGYVKIPKGHWLFGIHHNDLEYIDVHGGITYSAAEGNYWVFGFDTCHLYDNKANCDQKFVELETIRFAKLLYNIKEPEKKESKFNHMDNCEGCGNIESNCYC